jgi:ABC-type nickel/cobalt efflux system permease component RcnA
MFCEAPMAIDPYIQYGSFGLIVAMIVWMLTKAFPQAMATHRESLTQISSDHKVAVSKLADEHRAAINAICERLTEESEQCRQERIATAQSSAAEREKYHQALLSMRA